jgi:hypothetical protein
MESKATSVACLLPGGRSVRYTLSSPMPTPSQGIKPPHSMLVEIIPPPLWRRPVRILAESNTRVRIPCAALLLLHIRLLTRGRLPRSTSRPWASSESDADVRRPHAACRHRAWLLRFNRGASPRLNARFRRGTVSWYVLGLLRHRILTKVGARALLLLGVVARGCRRVHGRSVDVE